MGSFAREGKAFGIFANGTRFEETVAFRAFDHPLEVGDVFSFKFKFSGFLNKLNRPMDRKIIKAHINRFFKFIVLKKLRNER